MCDKTELFSLNGRIKQNCVYTRWTNEINQSIDRFNENQT